MKLYIVRSGQFIDYDNEDSYDSFWSSEEKAKQCVLNIIKDTKFKPSVHRKTRKIIPNKWDNGYDYIHIQEVSIDTEDIYEHYGEEL